MISSGVGSYVWLSAPGFSSILTSALSPAICRAKSYSGKLVQTIENLSGVCPEEGAALAHVERTAAAKAAATTVVRFFFFIILNSSVLFQIIICKRTPLNKGEFNRSCEFFMLQERNRQERSDDCPLHAIKYLRLEREQEPPA